MNWLSYSKQHHPITGIILKEHYNFDRRAEEISTY